MNHSCFTRNNVVNVTIKNKVIVFVELFYTYPLHLTIDVFNAACDFSESFN